MSRKLTKIKDNTFCRLKPSPISGVGVFAIRDIPAGTNVFRGTVISGHFDVSAQELATLSPNLARYIKDMCVFEEGNYKVPNDGLNAIDISFYLNHSKTPNARAEDNGEFITIKTVKEGEEITVDYGTYNDEEPEGSFYSSNEGEVIHMAEKKKDTKTGKKKCKKKC